MKFAVLTLAILLFQAAPAAAQALEPNAQLLKEQIEGFIENQQRAATKSGAKLTAKGEVTAEKASGYYAFTLPSLTYTDAQGVASHIGMIAVNAAPDGKDNWKVTLAVPTPINSYDALAKPLIRTEIGSQTATGTWNTKLGHFTALEATLGQVNIYDLVDQKTLSVGTASLISALSPDDNQAWAGQAKTRLETISLYDGETKFTGNLPKIEITSNLTTRAADKNATKTDISTRLTDGRPDGLHLMSLLLGSPQNLTAIVTGLDSVATQLQRSMITASQKEQQYYLTNMLAVSAVNGIGRPVQNDATSKSYELTFGPNGSFSVNGMDISALTQAKAQ